jgi:hypothetical protein
MKIKYLFFVALIVSALIVTIRCSKDSHEPALNQSEQLQQESDAVVAHILAFKERMAYCLQNPTLKSSVYYTPQEAVTEIESALSLTYCYSNIDVREQKITSSVLTMPLSNGEISETELAVFQEEVIDSLQDHMINIEYEEKKLMVVDMEYLGLDSNEDALVNVISVIANNQQVFLHNDAWWYGLEEGSCSGSSMPEDATTQLQARVIQEMLPDPPSGHRWFWIYTNTDVYTAGTSTQLDPTPDNYCDYKLFYAVKEPPLTIGYDEKCLSPYEMVFYEGYYIELADSSENYWSDLFKTCIVEDYTAGSVIHPDEIEHKLTVIVGDRYSIAIGVEELIPD